MRASRKKIELPKPRYEEWANREFLSRKHATLLAVDVSPTSEEGAAIFELMREYVAADRDPRDAGKSNWKEEVRQNQKKLEAESRSDPVLVETAADNIRDHIEIDHPETIAEAMHVWNTICDGVLCGKISERSIEQARRMEDRELDAPKLADYLRERGIDWPFSVAADRDAVDERIASSVPVANDGGYKNRRRMDQIRRIADSLYEPDMTVLPRGAKGRIWELARRDKSLFHSRDAFDHAWKNSNVREGKSD